VGHLHSGEVRRVLVLEIETAGDSGGTARGVTKAAAVTRSSAALLKSSIWINKAGRDYRAHDDVPLFLLGDPA